MSKSKFIKVRCNKCKHEQVIFGKASSVVNCLGCGNTLAESGGGKARIRALVVELLS